MSDDSLKRSDQIKMLEVCRVFTDEGKWDAVFTYPNCGYDLVQSGLANLDKTITKAGRAALWLLGRGADVTEGQSFQKFGVPLKKSDG